MRKKNVIVPVYYSRIYGNWVLLAAAVTVTGQILYYGVLLFQTLIQSLSYVIWWFSYDGLVPKFSSSEKTLRESNNHLGMPSLLGCLCGPVIKWAFGRRCRKVVSRGREDRRLWYRETMFSQMVSYEFLLHGALHGYFLYLVCAPREKPTRRCEPEERYLRCSKRFDHGSHSIIFFIVRV